MPYALFMGTLKQKMSLMVLIGLLFAALGFTGLMLFEKRYQSTTDFLIVQTNTGNQDFYTQFKSSEYLGKLLGESIGSERFINAVIGTGKINAEVLPFDKKNRLESWNRMVKVEKNLELGVITVTVKSDSDRDAARLMDGISDVLINQNSLFRGGDPGQVEIRVLSGPIVERTPTVSSLVKVVVAAFFFGFFLVYAVALGRRSLTEELWEEEKKPQATPVLFSRA
jgi:capsular polysaccharide biosynthesis protein